MKVNEADSTTDDLEPLFDYRRVQPLNIVCIDDDCADTSPIPSPKRRKCPKPGVAEVDSDKDVELIKVVNVEEEDWLAPPPMVSSNAHSKIGEDSTIKELRRRKQELLSLAQSAKTMLLEAEESTKREPSDSLKPSSDAVAEQPTIPASERAKIVISIQNKDEVKQFRVYTDDKFEKLFRLYANKAKLDLQSLAFSFDGDKINVDATPASLEMEDDDIIEVHVKKC
ncbi:uncharacterized protein LOC120143822 isoform X1 [Hibiscus syriacus]|uniref:uncharacterized protein LOC120143822 isoform X1 n=1 Tax=Hibiscus syriacus TaxID=106335 RepID=UPI001920AC8A|nr:uncharacterized protein LOC120143822 isoform X1 [Hibiscus syriacus]XP_039013983.1 uncharacterized protein LOC120143822 isoform X1 [Hibiscus syriacus]